MVGCGRRFFIKRYGNNYIMRPTDPEYSTTKKEIVVCGDNFSLAICPECEAKLKDKDISKEVIKDE